MRPSAVTREHSFQCNDFGGGAMQSWIEPGETGEALSYDPCPVGKGIVTEELGADCARVPWDTVSVAMTHTRSSLQLAIGATRRWH